MAFANFSVLAFGSLLMGVPILLHLMMRRKPRHQVFPAMRFLQQRQVANQRQMRLRHWLLLTLRIVAIGLLAALFARPSVDSVTSGMWFKGLLMGALAPFAVIAAIYSWSEEKGPALLLTFTALSLMLIGGLGYFVFQSLNASPGKNLGDQDAPVAAALVFDTSPRMGLLHQSKTRLQEAQALAKELLQELPPDSEVAIVDASGPGVFSVDAGNSFNMLESLQVLGYEYPLVDLVRRGIDLVASRSDKRQEVYVLTDLSEVVWEGTTFRPVRAQLDQHPNVSLFILDVGVEEPRNVQLGNLSLNTDSLAIGQPLRLETTLKALGGSEGEEVTVELSIEQQDPTRPVIIDDQVALPDAIVRERAPFALSNEADVPLVFEESNLPPGIHHGRIQLTAVDGLPIDDARYFTVEVRPPTPVLMVTSAGAEPSYVEQVLSPTELREQKRNAFDCRIVNANELAGIALNEFAVVVLLDPEPLGVSTWKQMEAYVRGGGSLAMFLGRNVGVAQPFNALAGAVLPGELRSHWVTAPNEVLLLAPSDTSHPMWAPIRGQRTIIAWHESPVFRHWTFSELDTGASVILRYSNNQPAIIESVVGEGRVLTVTTPLSDKRNQPQRPAWNHLPTSDDPLPFFVVVYGMFPYLADQSRTHWNHPVGEVVELAVESMEMDATWQLFTPGMDWQNVRSDEGKLTVTNTNAPGHYRLKRDQETSTGFSTNLLESATQLKRLDRDTLDDIFGANRYTLTRGTDELERGIGQARIGRELFPFLMLSVVAILAMEYLVSNRFYGPPTQRAA